MSNICIWCETKPRLPGREVCSELCDTACMEFLMDALVTSNARQLREIFSQIDLDARAKKLADGLVLEALHEEGGSAIDPQDLALFVEN